MVKTCIRPGHCIRVKLVCIQILKFVVRGACIREESQEKKKMNDECIITPVKNGGGSVLRLGVLEENGLRFDSCQRNNEKRKISFGFVKTHYNICCTSNYQKMTIQPENNRKYFSKLSGVKARTNFGNYDMANSVN